MFFQGIKTKRLGHNAYILGCGERLAVVVDPRRDVDDYVKLARDNNLRIAYVLETHRQEDFEFGSQSLSDITGAKIVTGTHALFGRSDVRLADGEAFQVGTTRFVALATPGHTPESMSYAVYPQDTGKTCWAVLTGDCLFVGDTGRTDLTDPDKTGGNAGLLHDSVHQKIAPLGNQAFIFPAHGSGSACGGNISERDDTTLGIEKATNPVFKKSREAFMALKCSEKLPRPPYFTHMEQVNLVGGRALGSHVAGRVLTPREFQERMQEGVVIDTRPPEAFAGSHIQGSYNIWLESVATFGGWIADEKTKIFLIVEQPEQAPTAIAALARIGIDSVQGVLCNGLGAWREAGLPIDTLGTTSAQQAAQWLAEEAAHVLDVRDEMEWAEKHIPGTRHTYVGHLEDNLPPVPKSNRLVVHCSVGHRSGLAVSILRRHGFTAVFNMLGGIKAWEALGLPLKASA